MNSEFVLPAQSGYVKRQIPLLQFKHALNIFVTNSTAHRNQTWDVSFKENERKHLPNNQ